MATDSLLGLFKLRGLLGNSPLTAPTFKVETPSFMVQRTVNPSYVLPDLKCDWGELKAGDTPKIILISAAGATGKSELTRYMSAELNIPIFNLAAHPPVASSSLTGLFFESLGAAGLAGYVGDLQEGRSSLMIDALDEGSLKTTAEGFNAFLDGIVGIAKESKATPFILLGRTNVVDHCWAYLEDKGVQTAVLRLQPFTLPQARTFIDNWIGTTNYGEQYRLVRDYILDSVDGLIKNRSNDSSDGSDAFIGYAPVLQAIVVLLTRTKNYKALYSELQAKKDRGIDLIIHIVEEIMRRERQEKIWPILNESILKGKPQEFVTDFEANAYSNVEQCARILCYLTGDNPRIAHTDDPVFNQKYEEKISEWLKDHPFLQDQKIQNSVFECYILARLMKLPEYRELVLYYLQTMYKDAFMLFFVYDKLFPDRKADPHFLPYLYSSFKSLDDSNDQRSLEVDAADEDAAAGKRVACEVDFIAGAEGDRRYRYTMVVEPDESLVFGNVVSSLFINAPISVALDANRVTLTPPVSISCAKLTIHVNEFVLESCKGEKEILLETDDVRIDYTAQRAAHLIDYSNKTTRFSIVTDSTPQHPFTEFYSNSVEVRKLDRPAMEKYLRLRGIIMLFRSHSKGSLAKFREKIEHKRVLKNDVGDRVLQKLVEKGILFLRGPMYHLDREAVHTYLGISYQDLKRKEVNPKVLEFLNGIEVPSEVLV